MPTDTLATPDQAFTYSTLGRLAESLRPEGSTVEAVLDQWALAIRTDSSLFGLSEAKQRALRAQATELLSELANHSSESSAVPLPPPSAPDFRFIDLFAGIGGMRLGFQRNNGLCVFSSEYDPSAQRTYAANYGEHAFGDITNIDECSIPDHDVLLAGFPCQPFSHAGVSARTAIGKSHGFLCDVQGTLFFDVLRIINEKKPKAVLLENVRNIERHDGGNTFRTIRKSIEDAGYSFDYKILSASSLVPQKRVRCYMVCFRNDITHDFTFPNLDGPALPLKNILEPVVDEKFTISDRLWKGHIDRTNRNLARGTGFTAFTADIDKPSNTLVARYGKDGKECLIPQKGKNPRMLSPRECARLQGFPESFLIPSAKTPAYKQFGNSVVVPLIELIAKNLSKEIL